MENKETKIIHETKKDILRCPKCQAEIMEEILFCGGIFHRKKKIIYYCPLCDFESEKIFKLNEKQFRDGIEQDG